MRAAFPAAEFWAEFSANRIAVGALAVVVILATAALAAPLIVPQDPYDLGRLALVDARRPPGSVSSQGFTFWLGSDAQGRDILSAILFGLRTSIQTGRQMPAETARHMMSQPKEEGALRIGRAA